MAFAGPRLKPKQHIATDPTVQGTRDQEASEAVGVTRQTINRWRGHESAFIAELNRRRCRPTARVGQNAGPSAHYTSRTTRKPRLRQQVSGAIGRRTDAVAMRLWWKREPPRVTRCVPSAGPVGSVCAAAE